MTYEKAGIAFSGGAIPSSRRIGPTGLAPAVNSVIVTESTAA